MCYIFCTQKKITWTDTKLFVRTVTLSTQDNAKLIEKLKCGFKKLKERENEYLDFLNDLSFQGVNRLSVLLFENNNDRLVHTA